MLGHKITIVGDHDARTSSTHHVEGSAHTFSTGVHEIVSDKEIVLRVGKSVIRLSADGLDIIVDDLRLVTKRVVAQAEDKIELFAAEQVALVGDKIDLLASRRAIVAGEQGVLRLAKDARLDGSVVKLNCDPAPPEPLEPPEYEPLEPTTIELADEQGKPLKNRPFILTLGDQSQRAGVTDDEGKAVVYLEESCEITFPNVDGARRG